MSRHRLATTIVSLAAACAAGGCTNPDAETGTPAGARAPAVANAGEPRAPAPPSPARQAPAEVQPTAQGALGAFAQRYINWSYQTLAFTQRTLAAISLASARLAEQQAAAASGGDPTIREGHIHNSGQVVSVARDLARRGLWIVVTLEQTGGDSSYQGLPAAYHVTLARVTPVAGGFAVSEWLPQS